MLSERNFPWGTVPFHIEGFASWAVAFGTPAQTTIHIQQKISINFFIYTRKPVAEIWFKNYPNLTELITS
jgi:hypothetical protein